MGTKKYKNYKPKKISKQIDGYVYSWNWDLNTAKVLRYTLKHYLKHATKHVVLPEDTIQRIKDIRKALKHYIDGYYNWHSFTPEEQKAYEDGYQVLTELMATFFKEDFRQLWW